MKRMMVAVGVTATLLYGDVPLKQKIGQMLMVGFHGTSAKPGSKICKDIRRYNLGGVILFDYNPVDKTKPKNIASKAQVASLTKELQACSRDGKLLIAVDQEGGRVQRLKSKYGFYGKFPKAADVVKSGSGSTTILHRWSIWISIPKTMLSTGWVAPLAKTQKRYRSTHPYLSMRCTVKGY